MLKLILSICLLTSLATRGQESKSLTVTNTWGKSSNLLYLGVENQLLVGRTGNYIQATCQGASLVFNEDSTVLKVFAQLSGPLEITFTDGLDTLRTNYNVVNFPLPSLSLGEGNHRASEIAPNELEEQTLVHVHAHGLGAEVFTTARIRSYELQVGEKNFEIEGNALTSDVREAIHRAEGMATIILKKVMLELPETGKIFGLSVARRYRVGKCGVDNSVAVAGR